MTSVVSYDVQDGIAVISIDNPGKCAFTARAGRVAVNGAKSVR